MHEKDSETARVWSQHLGYVKQRGQRGSHVIEFGMTAYTARRSSLTSNLAPLPPLLPFPLERLLKGDSTPSSLHDPRLFLDLAIFPLQSSCSEFIADRRSPLEVNAMSWIADEGGLLVGFRIACCITRLRALKMKVGAKLMKLAKWSIPDLIRAI